MLRLKNVSKFYYNKGIIASGFSKVNISFEIGEFVVITGESGSGKSTLLNVISGLDSYEEGEMYINGEETSHYGELELDEYRKKYVSNIFQSFNLVNSYTVYQNVELVLLMNGYKKREIKDKVLGLIDQVGLSRYKNTKVSKLSGGQKQRVAIARALAKETPIIVCDEPTANLDSKSSGEIIKILKEISHNKLVIMVTHDNSLVEKVASRIVKMHDGKIVADKKLALVLDQEKIEVNDSYGKKIGLFNIVRLGVRNTFNIIPKFVLLFLVFFFITTSVFTVYGFLRQSEYESSKLGYNFYFSDTSDTRIVVKKKNGGSISEDDIKEIENIKNVDYIVRNDILLDNYLWFDALNDKGFYLSGLFRDIEMIDFLLDYGRMPESDNEVVVLVNRYEYTFIDNVDDALKETYYLNGDKNSLAIKVVGVKYIDDDMFYTGDNLIYGNKSLSDEYMIRFNIENSDINTYINDVNYLFYYQPGYEFYITVSDKVRTGEAIVSENINYTCKDFSCKNKNLRIDVKNIYFNDSIDLKISNVYNEKNVNSLVGINKDNVNYGSIFISRDDYNKLFKRDSYQISVFADRVDYVDDVSRKLEENGYETLEMRRALNNDGENAAKVIKIVKLVVVVVLLIALFFISYFVIKLILKSRNVYFSTLRILGATSSNMKRILDVELFVNSNLAYLGYVLFVLLIKNDILKIDFIKGAIEYLYLSDYILMYLVMVMMSYLISSRFSSKIFKKSAMKSYREEV